jgi:esterase/lipase superfamily enzyme
VLSKLNRVIFALSTAILPLFAQQPPSISGTVISQTGLPVPGVLIEAAAGTAGATTQSDQSGHFAFSALPPNTYDIKAEAAGYYSTLTRGVPVTAGESFEIEIRLAPKNPTETRGGTYTASVRIFYATDRKHFQGDRLAGYFSGERALNEPLQLGTAEVTVPYRHAKAQLESPTSILGVSFQPDPRKHFVLEDVTPAKEEPFLRAISSQLQKPGSNSILVFIHGYANTFEDGALRLAQFTLDTEFRGVPILFSWPSTGTIAGYKKDEGNIEWATFHFQAFIEKLAATYPKRPIYLVGHSMGSRALSYALRNLALSGPPANLSVAQIILAAPDIDAAVFRELSSSYRKLSSHVTLYVSADDFALKQSRRLAGYPRAGQGGEDRLLIEGVDTIDCTGLDAGFLAHSYYAENRSVIDDVSEVIRGAAVSERKGLTAQQAAGGKFYRILK